MTPRSKYSAKKTVCGAGHLHDSKMEAARCDDLHVLLAIGEIDFLEQQPVFRVEIAGNLMCRYVADFAWGKADVRIVEDVKGVATPMFNLKKKLVEATHPGVVITVYPPRKRKTRKVKISKAYNPASHDLACAYHVDQYPHECTCGALKKKGNAK